MPQFTMIIGSAIDRRPKSRCPLDLAAGSVRGPLHADGPGVGRPGCSGPLYAVLQSLFIRWTKQPQSGA